MIVVVMSILAVSSDLDASRCQVATDVSNEAGPKNPSANHARQQQQHACRSRIFSNESNQSNRINAASEQSSNRAITTTSPGTTRSRYIQVVESNWRHHGGRSGSSRRSCSTTGEDPRRWRWCRRRIACHCHHSASDDPNNRFGRHPSPDNGPPNRMRSACLVPRPPAGERRGRGGRTSDGIAQIMGTGGEVGGRPRVFGRVGPSAERTSRPN